MPETGINPGILSQHQQTMASLNKGVGYSRSDFHTTSRQHQQSFSETPVAAALGGAMSGALSNGPWGALIGAGSSLLTQVIANKQNQQAQSQAQATAERNAAKAYQREQLSQDKANEWNRESSQISRFIEAGLSPGLMYGQMSDSSASAVSAPAADTVAPMASALQDPKLLEALGVYLQQLQTGSNIGLQGAQARNFDANTQGTQIDNQTRQTRNLQEIQTSLAQMYDLLASARKSGAETSRIERLLEQEFNLMESQINANAASARVANSTVDVLHPSLSYANYGSGSASYANANYTNGPLTSKTEQETSNLKVQENRGNFELTKDTLAYNFASKYLADHGFDGSLAPQLLKFLDSAPEDVLKGGVSVITSWLDGGNWLKFVNEWRRTSSWFGDDKKKDDPVGDYAKKPSFQVWADKSDDELRDAFKHLSEDAKLEVMKRSRDEDAIEWMMDNGATEDQARARQWIEAIRSVMMDIADGKQLYK